MRSKADTLARDLGTDLADSIGVRDDTGTTDQNPTPDQLDGLVRHKGTGLLLLSRIRVDPDQIRTETDPEADALLAESVRARGLLHPLRVRWDTAENIWVIVTGERRYRACLAAGMERAPVVCVTEELTPAAIISEQLCENLQRQSLSALDEARAFKKYLDLTGEPAVNLANLLHISQSTVSRAITAQPRPGRASRHRRGKDLAQGRRRHRPDQEFQSPTAYRGRGGGDPCPRRGGPAGSTAAAGGPTQGHPAAAIRTIQG